MMICYLIFKPRVLLLDPMVAALLMAFVYEIDQATACNNWILCMETSKESTSAFIGVYYLFA